MSVAGVEEENTAIRVNNDGCAKKKHTVMILSFRQSDQGLHCLQFCLHFWDAILYGKSTSAKF